MIYLFKRLNVMRSIVNLIWNTVYDKGITTMILIPLIFIISIILFVKIFKNNISNIYKRVKYILLKYKYYMLEFLDLIFILLLIDRFFQSLNESIITIIFGLTVSLISSITISKYNNLNYKNQQEVQHIINKSTKILNEFKDLDKHVTLLIANINKIQNNIIGGISFDKMNKNKYNLRKGFTYLQEFKRNSNTLINSINQLENNINKNIPKNMGYSYIQKKFRWVYKYINEIIGKENNQYKFYNNAFNGHKRYPHNIFSNKIQLEKIFFIKIKSRDLNSKKATLKTRMYPENVTVLNELLLVIDNESAWSVNDLNDVIKRIIKFKNTILQ